MREVTLCKSELALTSTPLVISACVTMRGMSLPPLNRPAPEHTPTRTTQECLAVHRRCLPNRGINTELTRCFAAARLVIPTNRSNNVEDPEYYLWRDPTNMQDGM